MKLRTKNFSIVGISHYEGSENVTIGDIGRIEVVNGTCHFYVDGIDCGVLPQSDKKLSDLRKRKLPIITNKTMRADPWHRRYSFKVKSIKENYCFVVETICHKTDYFVNNVIGGE